VRQVLLQRDGDAGGFELVEEGGEHGVRFASQPMSGVQTRRGSGVAEVRVPPLGPPETNQTSSTWMWNARFLQSAGELGRKDLEWYACCLDRCSPSYGPTRSVAVSCEWTGFGIEPDADILVAVLPPFSLFRMSLAITTPFFA